MLSPSAQVLKRIDRAGLHIDAYKTMADRFFQTEPYGVSEPEPDPEGTGYVMKVHIRDDPPFELSLILADAIHNLRASLDNLVWHAHMVRRCKPRRNLQFPIQFCESDFAYYAHGWLARLPTACYWVIEGLQPYRGPHTDPKDDPAAVLNRLWTWDKHKTTPLTLASLQRGAMGWYGDVEPPIWRVKLGPVEDGDVIAWCPVPLGTDVSNKPHFQFDISIRHAGVFKWVGAGDTLDHLYQFVRNKAYPAMLPFL